MVTLAHVGHWLESAAFALPPLLILAMLVTGMILAKRAPTDPAAEREVSG